jgi:hypothetical protein
VPSFLLVTQPQTPEIPAAISMTARQNNSIAHQLVLRLENFTGEAAGNLPYVDCEFCGGQPGAADADFPLVNASEFSDVLWKVNVKDLRPPRTNWAAFEKLIERGRTLTQNPTFQLVPGCALGPIKIRPIGRWPSVLFDIDFASPGGLLFSQELVDALKKKGFALHSNRQF